MVMLGGMVSSVKMLSLKHRVPSNLSVVLETYTESPRKDGVNRFDAPVYEITCCKNTIRQNRNEYLII